MHLYDNLGEAGSQSYDPTAGTAIRRDYRDHLVGRLLPPRRRLAGLLDAFDEALGGGAVTRRELEGIIAAAEGRPH